MHGLSIFTKNMNYQWHNYDKFISLLYRVQIEALREWLFKKFLDTPLSQEHCSTIYEILKVLTIFLPFSNQ